MTTKQGAKMLGIDSEPKQALEDNLDGLCFVLSAFMYNTMKMKGMFNQTSDHNTVKIMGLPVYTMSKKRLKAHIKLLKEDEYLLYRDELRRNV